MIGSLVDFSTLLDGPLNADQLLQEAIKRSKYFGTKYLQYLIFRHIVEHSQRI